MGSDLGFGLVAIGPYGLAEALHLIRMFRSIQELIVVLKPKYSLAFSPVVHRWLYTVYLAIPSKCLRPVQYPCFPLGQWVPPRLFCRLIFNQQSSTIDHPDRAHVSTLEIPLYSVFIHTFESQDEPAYVHTSHAGVGPVSGSCRA